MTSLRVYLFGGLRVYHGEEPLPPFPTQKTRSLFAYLVTFRRCYHGREVLAHTFWRDMPTSQARRNLNTTLWRLRKSVPAGYLQVREDSIAFDPQADYWLDVGAFEQALRRAGLAKGPRSGRFVSTPGISPLRQAVDLYRGDFLEGFHEDWVLVETERLRSLHLQALYGLLAYHRAGGEYELALGYAQRLLEQDSLREDVHQQAMELYELLDRRSEALVQFEACRDLLWKELAVAPMPETVALYERIRVAGEPARAVLPRHEEVAFRPVYARPAPLPRTPFDDFGQVALIGREDELAWLTARMEAAGRGQGGVVLLEGEAGVGKSRLVRELVRRAGGKGWSLLQGLCRELREPPPYQGWIEALRSGLSWLDPQGLVADSRSWLSEMTLLLPELRQTISGLPEPPDLPPSQRQIHLWQALLQYLRCLGQARPCLAVLEDLQWADWATLEALRYVAPRLQQVPVLVVGTARTEDLSGQAGEVFRNMEEGTALRRLVLPRLSQDETAGLAGAMLGWPFPDTRFAERLYQETGGNAFYVGEVLKGLFEDGRLVQDRMGRWHFSAAAMPPGEDEWPLPRGIQRAVRRRLERLDERSWLLLEVAAVLGRRMDFDLLWQASGWEEEVVLEATDDLLRRQLLVEVEDDLRFSHDKIQQVVYQGLERTHRRRLHRRAGEILEELDPKRVEELAHHYYLGRQPERALPYCLQAGERANTLYANQSALTYYGWAIETAQEVGGREARKAMMTAHELRGKVWEHLGDYAQARSDYLAMQGVARSLADLAAVARAVRRDAWVQGVGLGNWRQGLDGARRAWKLAEEAGNKREAAIALLDMGYFHNMRGEYAQALDTLRASLDISEELGDAGARAAALQFLAVTFQFLSRNDEALAAFQEAFQIWEKRDDRRRAAAMTLADMGYLQISQGHLGTAEEAFHRAKASLEEIEAYGESPWVLIGLAVVRRLRGESAEGRRLLERALELERSTGESPYNRALIHFHLGWTRWDTGWPGSGVGHMRQALVLARRSGTPTLVVGVLYGLARCRRLLGQAGRARDDLLEGLALARRTAFLGGELLTLADLGLVEVALGNLTEGRKHVERSVGLSRPLGPRAQGETLAALAEICLVEGDLKPARALAQRALKLAERTGLRLLQINALFLLGQARAALGRLAQAESALGRALQLADPPGYPVERWRILLSLALLLAERGQVEEAAPLWGRARAVVEEVLASLEDELSREAFRSQLAVRALLGEVAEAPLREGQVRQTVARLGTPSGRPLREDEQITVLWTVDAGPEDAALRLREGKVALRRRRIRRLLAEARLQGGEATEADLARALGVTSRTIRGDIAALRQAGHYVRTRGTRQTR